MLKYQNDQEQEKRENKINNKRKEQRNEREAINITWEKRGKEEVEEK